MSVKKTKTLRSRYAQTSSRWQRRKRSEYIQQARAFRRLLVFIQPPLHCLGKEAKEVNENNNEDEDDEIGAPSVCVFIKGNTKPVLSWNSIACHIYSGGTVVECGERN